MASTARRPLPRSYAHVPRTILWLIPGGEFLLDGRRHRVEPFYLGKWPITNEQFEAFDPEYERSTLSPGDRDLAAGVSWRRAHAYCRWYAEVSRKSMRLPTRVEWLYACLGRNEADDVPPWSAMPDLIERRCWHAGNSGGRVQHPERREANDFGLHGMLGSLWEWVAPDREDAGRANSGRHAGRDDGDRATLCGGSFRIEAAELHCGLQKRESVDFADDTGFRVARSFRIGSRAPA